MTMSILRIVIQKVEDFLREYETLLFSVAFFIFGIVKLLSKEERHSSGWLSVILSLGLLIKYHKDKSTNERLKKGYNILSYGITVAILIWLVVEIGL